MTQLYTWFGRATPVGLLLLALAVGASAAVGAAVFHAVILFVTQLFYGDYAGDFIGAVTALPAWQRVLIPAIGGLLVGLLFRITRVTEAEGEGVPEVMEALAEKRGKIRPVVAPVKIVAAALTLGSGGAAGREGPVIQIGSAIGSSIAQFFKLADKERSLLLASGAAAAIGGTFGAPLAGVIFTAEILQHRPSLWRALLIMVAAFVGQYGTKLLIPGYEGLRFSVDSLPPLSVSIGASMVVVGVLAGLGALLFGLILRRLRAVFIRVPVPSMFRPALGGLLIGLIGLYIPFIHEPAAYPFMVDMIALSSYSLVFLVTLFVVKMIATGITLGSGGAGGIFAPSLLLGTILGGVVGMGLVALGLVTASALPLIVVVAMAAVFAGAAHAPFTATFITYEMTGSVEIVLPLLLACIVSTVVAKRLYPQSVYHSHS